MRRRTIFLAVSGFIGAWLFVGCNSIVGLDDFSVNQAGSGGATSTSSTSETGASGSSSTGSAGSAGNGGSGTGGADVDGGTMDAQDEPRVVECHTNRECTNRATAAAAARYQDAGPPDGSDAGPPGTVPAMCVQSIGKCVELLSDDCKTITGDYLNDSAILLGTLFSTLPTQATSATNVARQQSATLAFEEINTKGGLPPAKAGGSPRPIVALSCDEFANGARAATHLVNDLHVAAIVGPNTSQDTITLSQNISIKGGTVMMTPSGVASSIADLNDDDLTWLMAPSDVQRAPLMIQQINALETQLKAARNKSTIKFGIIYRDDALGQGTQTALIPLNINGMSLASQNMTNVRIDSYTPSAPNQDALVAKYRDFAPDIIALAGTAEAITAVMNPLEAAWNSDGGTDRPYYVTIDSAKVQNLLDAAKASTTSLRTRVRGTGITPTMQSKFVLDAFNIAYGNRYPGQSTSFSSMGPSYDAAYAIAYAIAAIKDLPVTGKNVAAGLRKLAGGPTMIEVGSTQVLKGFNALTSGGDGGGENITAVGTFGPLEWDKFGAPVSATLEMWCVATGASPTYASSGLTYDLKSGQFNGSFSNPQCQ